MLVRINAPDVVLVVSVPLVITTLAACVVTPLVANVVNLPVLAVVAPIGVLSTLPPVITALADAKLAIVPVVPLKLVIPDKLPPVAWMLLVAKLAIVPVVPFKLVIPDKLPPVTWMLPELKFWAYSVVTLPLVAFNVGTVNVVALIVVNVPAAGVKLPIGVLLILANVALPPLTVCATFNAPAIPTPPLTRNAPVDELELTVALATTNSPPLIVPYVPEITLPDSLDTSE